MQVIPEQIINSFLDSLELRVDSQGMAECARCVISFLIEQGFIKPCKIRAYMVSQLYPKALAESDNKTQAVKKVASWLEVDYKTVWNILSNRHRY